MNRLEPKLPEIVSGRSFWIGPYRMETEPSGDGDAALFFCWVDLRGHDFGGAALEGAVFFGCLVDDADFSDVPCADIHFACCCVTAIDKPPRFGRVKPVLHGDFNNFTVDRDGSVDVDARVAAAAARLMSDALAHNGLFGYPELFESIVSEVPSPMSLVAPLAQLCFVPSWPLSENALHYLQPVLKADMRYESKTDPLVPWQQEGVNGDSWRLLCLYLCSSAALGAPELQRWMDTQIADADWSRQWGRSVGLALAAPWATSQDARYPYSNDQWVFSLAERLLTSSKPLRNTLNRWLTHALSIPWSAWPRLRRILGRMSVDFLLHEEEGGDERAKFHRVVDDALRQLLRCGEPARCVMALDLMDTLSPVDVGVYEDLLSLPSSFGDSICARAAWHAYDHWLGHAQRLKVLNSGRLTEPYLTRLASSDDPSTDWIGYTSERDSQLLFEPTAWLADLLSSDSARQTNALRILSIFPYPQLRADVLALTQRSGSVQAAAIIAADRYANGANG